MAFDNIAVEPTLYHNLTYLIGALKDAGRKVYLTTNGSRLIPAYCHYVLRDLDGLNISIHDYDLEENERITGIKLDERTLYHSVKVLQDKGVNVRLNCNVIEGHMDDKFSICSYIFWAKRIIGVDTVRFSELKLDDGHFVSLGKTFDYEYGLNEDPYKCGCNHEVRFMGMNVQFRQMCGFQTPLRPKPENPKQTGEGIVVYYDGKAYNGWQRKEEHMPKKLTTKQILQRVKDGRISIDKAQRMLERERRKRSSRMSSTLWIGEKTVAISLK